MIWQQWFFIAVFLLSTISTVGSVGKPREAVTPQLAALTVLFAAIFIGIIISI